MIAVFGFGSQLPFRIVLGIAVALLGVLVYALVSRRVGWPLGLVAAAVIVFLGPAWEDLLWTFQIGLIGSLAAGLGVFLAMERDTPRMNALACGLLVVSVSLSNVGLPFVLAAAVAVVVRRQPGRLWIPLVPAALFALWWAGYGHKAPSTVSGANIRHLPKYVLDSASSGIASTLGISSGGWIAPSPRRDHVLLAVVLVTVAAVWATRRGRPTGWLLVFATALLSFWILTGANYIPGREATASRYQLVSATLLILLAAELFRGASLGRMAVPVVLAVAAFAFSSNLGALSKGYSFMRLHTAYAQADLGALQLARGVAPPNTWLVQAVARDPYLSGVTAARYFSETRAHGSPPVYSPSQIAAAPAGVRQAADSVLSRAYDVGLHGARRQRPTGVCTRLPEAAGERGADVRLVPPGAVVTDVGPAPLVIYVRRFAPAGLATAIGFMAPRSSARLAIHPDSVGVPWRLAKHGGSALVSCRA